MKALKRWGWMLAAGAIALHMVGVFSGEYDRFGWWGTSAQAQLLTGLSAMSALLAMTVLLVVRAIEKK